LEKLPKNEFIISIDSNKFEVQRKTVELGAHLINDVFGGSESLFKLAEEKQIALVLMHTSGKPDEMQSKTDYKDVVSDILKWMEDKKKITDQYNIPKIWFDPGIGFGKTLDQNLDLMENIHLFTQNEFPILLGSSRKSWIGTLTNASVENRIGGSLASIARGLESDVDIFRVHDVFETEQFIRSYLAMKDKHRLPWTN
jgi:dihydropteroate synthase